VQFFRLQILALPLSLLAVAAFWADTTASVAHAQTITTGALSGVVSDATGAVVPGANVTVTSVATNTKQVLETNGEGRYTVSLLQPGTYRVAASAPGLKSETVQVTVLLGTTATGNIVATPAGNTTVVEISAGTLPLVDTENVALATTLNTEQIQDLPAPGGDVTTVAYTAPGVVVNAGGAYGNFSSDGLPGISNLFVLNGFDDQDPFENLNDTGSSNLTLGQGELADATVIQNAYNSQYGRAAGAIISYTTKSGGNQFHGEATYDYNGTLLNANGWFNNLTGTPRPHAVSNEWALNGGGPIIRNKLFFFSDWEGLRYVLPASGYVSLPTAQFEAYTMAHIPTAATSLYTQMFKLYNQAPSYNTATPTATGGLLDGGCGALTGVTAPNGNAFGTAVPCTASAYAQANNINQEWLYTQRVDWDINDKHQLYGRFKMDRGSQPTYTSYINPAFDAVSTQPEYEGQLSDHYAFSSHLINSAVVAANWYTAAFGAANPTAAAAALPFYANFETGLDGSGTSDVPGLTTLGAPFYFPQGRNVTQYQLEDDVSWSLGKHNLTFGANFRRDLITDFDQQEETEFPQLTMESLLDVAQGQFCAPASDNNPGSAYCGSGDNFQQAFITSNDAHLALYNIGVYLQDEWQATQTLKLTIGARFDRTGDPLCQGGCFSLYNSSFPNATASLNTPYSKLINPANAHPYSVDPFYFQPRFGFNYQLTQQTVLRGGVGYFADLYPAGFLDGPIQNFPNYNLQTVSGGVLATSGTGSIYANAASANTAVQSGFKTGTVTSINSALAAQGISFAPPSLNAYFPGTFHEPEYVEFSLQIQHQFTKYDGLALTYAGNYGYHEIIQNPFLNASSGIFSSAITPNPVAGWTSAGSFGNYGATPPDPNFGEVNEYSNSAHSNYNGATVEYTHIGNGITAHLAYTYSHALDEISNGGVGEYYNDGSITKQLTPSLGPGNLNYSNADYDIRNDLVGDLVYTEPFKASNRVLNQVVSGWILGAKTYYRSGMPFSVNNTGAIDAFPNMSTINNPEGSTSLMPTVTSWNLTNSCGSNPHGAAVNGGCLNAAQYDNGNPAAQTTYGNLRRNAFYGPHYADTDATLSKQFYKKESMAFELGAQAYNIFNHPNFANPGSAYPGDSSNQITSTAFGSISAVVAPPTSPYGSFQSAAVTQRVLVVTGKITF
jgi:Carboxypeptidase regulatory-like domain